MFVLSTARKSHFLIALLTVIVLTLPLTTSAAASQFTKCTADVSPLYGRTEFAVSCTANWEGTSANGNPLRTLVYVTDNGTPDIRTSSPLFVLENGVSRSFRMDKGKKFQVTFFLVEYDRRTGQYVPEPIDQWIERGVAL